MINRQQIVEPIGSLPSNYCFNGIDLIKFFCSYLVCMVHIPFISGVDSVWANEINYYVQNSVSRIAVPFFFAASGFLLFRKIDINNINFERIKKYCYRLLLLLGVWFILLFVGNIDQLWYLGGSVIVTLMLTVFLEKKISYKVIGIISIVLYSLGLLMDSYSGFVKSISNKIGITFFYDSIKFFDSEVSRTIRLGVFFAFVFFIMGVLFVYKPIRMNIPVAIIGFIVSILLLIVEAYFVKIRRTPLDNNMYISLLPATFFLFYIATHLKLKDRKIYSTLRAMGVIIFFIHLFVYRLIEYVFLIAKNYSGIDLSVFTLTSVITVSTVFAYFFVRLSNKEKYKLLRFLY